MNFVKTTLLLGAMTGLLLAVGQLFIVNPLSGRGLGRLFSTHPPLEERIARLMAMRG